MAKMTVGKLRKALQGLHKDTTILIDTIDLAADIVAQPGAYEEGLGDYLWHEFEIGIQTGDLGRGSNDGKWWITLKVHKRIIGG